MTTATLTRKTSPEPTLITADAPWSKGEWPDRPWCHPSLADYVAAHADDLAPLIDLARHTHAAFAQLRERQRTVADQDTRLQADLIEAAGDEADRLITQAIALHVEKQTLPARLAEHERRFVAARLDLLERIQQLATAEAQAVEAGIVEPRRNMVAIDRSLMSLEGTRPEIKQARAELEEKRRPLARTVVAGNRQFAELRDVVAIARAMADRGQGRKAA